MLGLAMEKEMGRRAVPTRKRTDEIFLSHTRLELYRPLVLPNLELAGPKSRDQEAKKVVGCQNPNTWA
jgi:hypothetical protein